MNTETMELAFPTIDADSAIPASATPAQSTALAEKTASEIEKTVVSIKDAAIAHLRAKEPAIVALADKYRNVALPLGTPKDLAAGKAIRLELREAGRFGIQRDRDATKDLLNDAKKHVETETEADRLIGIVRPVEDHVHAQIEARETVLAEEKAERERLAAERRAGFEAGIARIRGYVAAAKGLPSERIERGIAQVEALAFGEDWAEFASPAAAAQGETVAALRELLATTLAAEATERQRVENARIAAEQAAERQRLADAQAELDRRAEALAEQEREAEAAREAEAERIEVARLAEIEAQQRQQMQSPPAGPVADGSRDSNDGAAIPAVKAGQDAQADQAEVPSSPGTPGAYASTGSEAAQPPGSSGDEDDGAHAEERAPESASSDVQIGVTSIHTRATDAQGIADSIAGALADYRPTNLPATLKLGDICKRLGFNITEAFVRDTLKLSILTDRRAVLILASDWPALKAALMAHIGGLE